MRARMGLMRLLQYIAFIVIMLTGSFVLPFFLLPSDKVVRSDGTRVVLPEMPTWK